MVLSLILTLINSGNIGLHWRLLTINVLMISNTAVKSTNYTNKKEKKQNKYKKGYLYFATLFFISTIIFFCSPCFEVKVIYAWSTSEMLHRIN